ncbi:hypothetical protein AVEN_230660-2-1, partial [Araneus ventricosus]
IPSKDSVETHTQMVLYIPLYLKPCSHGMWLGETSSRSRFVLVDCGIPISRAVPTARGLANLSAALE